MAHLLHCHCPHTPDLEVLRDEYGADASAMAADLAPRMRCAVYQRRAVGSATRPTPASIRGMGVANDGYAKAKDAR
ncbi:hypothetical protein [Mesorhizobium sp. M0088]|uniref:hypothetical protein n=1 Tax=Mesorhizobium sp. M0088 TaxID=2956873 RepID=UPI0033383FFD